ncbi:hypothetical protein [Silvanigrella aquatica]|uniref:hypothetical protein n=1 Tax=Silvanigrella aquatica TaxID=1915309 RepID=UPI000B271EEC|nr:hypothetical protein [Silvanigrella aquatica]
MSQEIVVRRAIPLPCLTNQKALAEILNRQINLGSFSKKKRNPKFFRERTYDMLFL